MVTRTTNLSVPGVFFLPAPAAPAPELPPLEVAGFVGFAERGPCDLPVAVEDLSAYRAIFGDDLALAQDAGDQPVFAQLPGAVADFFANGGRRCYVVRVAGPAARAARFTLPGLLALDPSGQAAPALLATASPGRWADGLALATRLEITPLPATRFSLDGPRALSWDASSAPAALRRGDLLRLTLPDRRRFLAPIADIVRPSDPLRPPAVELAGAWELQVPAPASPRALTSGTLLRAAGSLDLAPLGDFLADSQDFAVTVGIDPAALEETSPPAAGELLALTVAGARAAMPIREVRELGEGGSPPARRYTLYGRELLLLSAGDLPIASPPGWYAVERLRLAIGPRLGNRVRPPIADLAFNAGHPRFWGVMAHYESGLATARPRDAEDSGWLSDTHTTGDLRESRATPPRGAADLAAEQFAALAQGRRPAGPRDPVALAALLAPLGPVEDWLFLPLGMPGVITQADFGGQALAGSDDLGRLDAALFLDPALRAARSPAGLLNDAMDRHAVQELRLTGAHSLLAIDEVSVVAAPDASQLPWGEADPEPLPDLPAPPPPPDPAPCPERRSEFADCARPPTVAAINPSYGPVAGGTPVAISGGGFDQPDGMRVSFGGRPAEAVSVESDALVRCVTPPGGVPESVAVVVTTRDGSATLADGFTYLAPSSRPGLPRLEPPSRYDLATAALLPVQQALIQICQARRDMLALLSLPPHFTRRECIVWQQELRSALGLPARRVSGDNEGGADLSYAAVYHPWLLRRDDRRAGRVRAGAPEGAVAGLIAARERERGVWVAPANRPLAGVVGLSPSLSGADWAELFALQLNLVRPEARDFRPMSAHTLSDERALLQLSVRRLLILIRKAAVDRGMAFVFESNHERFRQAARALIERMLQGMYERGAFAGASPEQAYRVITGPEVNLPQSVEQGRFIAEIRVAPSQPAEFISVLLTRADDGGLRSSEG